MSYLSFYSSDSLPNSAGGAMSEWPPGAWTVGSTQRKQIYTSINATEVNEALSISKDILIEAFIKSSWCGLSGRIQSSGNNKKYLGFYSKQK